VWTNSSTKKTQGKHLKVNSNPLFIGGDFILLLVMKSQTTEKPVKFEITYEDEESISVWKYNTNKTTAGPVEVEYRWKRSFNPWEKSKKKTMGELAKEMKKK